MENTIAKCKQIIIFLNRKFQDIVKVTQLETGLTVLLDVG